jgi:glutaredoxin 2
MNVSNSKVINLFSDRLVQMASQNKITYESMTEIMTYLFWSFEMAGKKLPNSPGVVYENREANNYKTFSILAGDECSLHLKYFLNVVIGNSSRLQLGRSEFIKNKIHRFSAKEAERLLIKRLMKNQDDLESKLMDTLSLIDGYEECLTQDDLEKLLNQTSEIDGTE